MVFLIFSIETKNESNVSILHNKFVISVHKFKYSVVLKHLKKSWCILFQKPDGFFFKSTIFGCISQTRTTDYFQWKVSYNYSRKVGHECSTLNQSSLFIWHFFLGLNLTGSLFPPIPVTLTLISVTLLSCFCAPASLFGPLYFALSPFPLLQHCS